MSQTAPSPVIHTPDQRVRVYISADPDDLAEERQRAREAIEQLHLRPVMLELGARAHAPRDLSRAYLEQSQVFVGLYGTSLGPRGSDGRAQIADEYELAHGMPKLLYLRGAEAPRETGLTALVERFMADAEASFSYFDDTDELAHRLSEDLAVLLSERFDDPDRGAGSPGVPSKLPTPVNTFVGRRRELAEITELVADPSIRLITLTGPGGIGKSRLVIELGRRLEPAFPDGVHLVALEEVDDAGTVMDVIARGLGLSTVGRASPLDAIAAYATNVRPLVILDNFEHVLAAAPAVARMLEQVPTLTLLVTSRTPLQVRGEHEYPLGPLRVPESRHASGEDPVRYEAVQLFVDRAAAANRSFALTEDNSATVAAITRCLDGLPLALELAAARMRVLTAPMLLERLADRFGMLRGGLEDYPHRHQALWDTIQWSHDLLPAATRTCFAELGVFVGSWSLDAAEAVCSGSGIELLDTLSALVDASLVQPTPRCGTPRFSMLQSVRDFALAKLADEGAVDLLEERHARHYLAGLDRAAAGLRGPDQIAWLDRLDTDHGNIMAALRWAVGHGHADEAAAVAGGLWLWWWLRSRTAEADQLLALITGADLTGRPRAIAQAVHACMRWWQAHPQDALDLADAALAAFAEPADASWRAFCIGMRGLALEMLGETAPALAALTQSAEIAHAAADHLTEAVALNALAWSANLLGADVPEEVFERAVQVAERSGAQSIIAMTTTTRAHHLLLSGRAEQGRELMARGLELLTSHRLATSMANGLDAVASFAAAQGAPELAARLLGGTERVREVHAQPPMMTVLASRSMALASVQSALGEEATRQAWTAGRRMRMEDLVADARRWLTSEQGMPDTRQPT